MTDSTDDDPTLVPVLITGDASELAIAKSLLDAEGVECEIQGESGQEALGLGRTYVWTSRVTASSISTFRSKPLGG